MSATLAFKDEDPDNIMSVPLVFAMADYSNNEKAFRLVNIQIIFNIQY